jgi:hypothetical protein
MSYEPLREIALDEPIELPLNGLIDFAQYRSIAKTRIQYLDREAHCKLLRRLTFNPNRPETTATYIQQIQAFEMNAVRRLVTPSRYPKVGRAVMGLGIWINTGVLTGKDSVLRPYIEEHELHESWLMTAQDTKTQDAHISARRREFELAANDGKAQHLFEFQCNVNPFNEAEYQEAYDRAVAR